MTSQRDLGGELAALIQMGEEILRELDNAIFADITARFQEPSWIERPWTDADIEFFQAAWRKLHEGSP